MSLSNEYQAARRLAIQDPEKALSAYRMLTGSSAREALLIQNDLAVLHALTNTEPGGTLDLQVVARNDELGWLARANLAQLRSVGHGHSETGPRVAILSLLFNWPSQGGGIVHTAECGKFLQEAGYDVRHFYAVYEPWQLGIVTAPTLCPATPLVFDKTTWNADSIRQRFRSHLQEFNPDFVIVTDSWNTKVLLCEAAHGYRYCIRLAAIECVCPLNNVRLLLGDHGLEQCDQNQLADREACVRCVERNERYSGSLHRDDRRLAGFYEADYGNRLRKSFHDAFAVLAVNERIAKLTRPYAEDVRVIPSGFDSKRFPPELVARHGDRDKTRILFAGVVTEVMKGFHVLQEAAAILWQRRQDFEVVATSDSVGSPNPFTRLIGWQDQATLPSVMAESDILAFPTIAQEALGRTAVEAMAAGIPVVASRIGGLPTTIADGETGLLCEPGNTVDLAAKLEQLLDDSTLRARMGAAGRSRFETRFTWEVVIGQYNQLFGVPHGKRSGVSA